MIAVGLKKNWAAHPYQNYPPPPSDKLTAQGGTHSNLLRHHEREPRGQSFPSSDHKAQIIRQAPAHNKHQKEKNIEVIKAIKFIKAVLVHWVFPISIYRIGHVFITSGHVHLRKTSIMLVIRRILLIILYMT